MIQRRSGTLGQLSGSNRSSSHFREFELTAEGSGTYEDDVQLRR